MDYKFTPEKIEAVLAYTGMSRSDLSRVLGISKGYTTQILTGYSPITDSLQTKLNVVFSELVNEQIQIQNIRRLKMILEGIETHEQRTV